MGRTLSNREYTFWEDTEIGSSLTYFRKWEKAVLLHYSEHKKMEQDTVEKVGILWGLIGHMRGLELYPKGKGKPLYSFK